MWSEYLATTRRETRALARELLGEADPATADLVTLTDWSPRDPVEAERALVTAALYAQTDLPENQVAARVARAVGRRPGTGAGRLRG